MKRKKYLLENILVTGYAAEGKSLARQDGKVIFIEGAVPGDVVDVFVSTNKKDYGEGKATRFHKYSTERTTPFCIHFGVCGGCKWQMLPYPKQLEYKQQEVAQNFRRIGKVELPEMMPIVGADDTTQYRNKLEFTFSNKEYKTGPLPTKALPNLAEGGALDPADPEAHAELARPGNTPVADKGALGFHVPRVFDKIIDIQECHLMDGINNNIRNSIRSFALANNYTYYDIKQHTGWLRNIIIRNCATGELMVNICLGYENQVETKKLLDFVLQELPCITTLLYTINPKWNDTIYDLTPQLYHGKGFVMEKLEEFSFKIGPKSFFQTNTRQAEKLYTIARDFAQLTGNEIVYDLYCGTGSIGIFVSKLAKKIIGVELVAEAIEDAKINAAINQIDRAEFFAGDVIRICDDDFFAEHGRPDVIFTDPPRAGMHEKLVNKLLEIAAQKIVYVSCNTATQARDLGLLSEKYHVEKIQPVDMFPHTHHIECVVLLKLKK
ncbi:MAG: 23S rRNA (uracil(1939)-C(5))-methyltransferase RlmD [Ferruginibacter sp.]|nr:23S rRNA (uracil(1939)-C(5))-methyltransferase RlmD [Ferruginibacter sp.]